MNLTRALWSLLLKSNDGVHDLKLLSISLCLAISVAKIHLKVKKEESGDVE